MTCVVCHEDNLALTAAPTTCGCKWRVCESCLINIVRAGCKCVYCHRPLRRSFRVPPLRLVTGAAWARAAPMLESLPNFALGFLYLYAGITTAMYATGGALWGMPAILVAAVGTIFVERHLSSVLVCALFVLSPPAAAAAALFMWDASYLVYVGAGGFLAAGVSLAHEARDFTRLVCFSNLEMNFVAPPPPPRYNLRPRNARGRVAA